jgi:hypothetical protein
LTGLVQQNVEFVAARFAARRKRQALKVVAKTGQMIDFFALRQAAGPKNLSSRKFFL